MRIGAHVDPAEPLDAAAARGADAVQFFLADPQGWKAPAARPDQGSLTSAIGSMNHIAFDVDPARMEEYRDKLRAAGVETTEIADHDDSEWGLADGWTDDVYVRSVYFQDPDGILLELAAWTRPFTEGETDVAPQGPVRPAP